MKHSGPLFRKYARVCAALVGGALLVSGLIELYFTSQETQAALARLQREKAAGAAAHIDQFLSDTEHQIAWVIQPQYAVGPVNIDERRLDYLRLLRLVPAITEVAYIDSSGREQLRVRRLAPDILGSQADFSQDPVYVEARARNTYYSPISFADGSEPHMVIAQAEPGQAHGVTATDVNLKLIYDVVAQIKVGDTGRAYLVDAAGELVVHPDNELVRRRTNVADLPQVQAGRATAAVGQSGGGVLVTHDLVGEPVLAAVQPIDGPGWLVVVEQPLGEAFAPLYASMWRILGFLVAGLALSIGASLFLARRMARPIQALQSGAARIGAGELELRIEVRSGDELETLADEFNRMADRLHDSYTELEQKVRLRTEALASALRELEDNSHQLEVASRHKSAFLANMSHELRTPLNAILGYTELIRDGIYGEVSDRIRGVLERVDISGRHLLGLINDVLDLSKIEAGELKLSTGDFSLGDVIQAVCAAIEPLASEKGLRVAVDIEPDLPVLRGDERRITQVVLNLAGNAVKFTDRGEVKLVANMSDGWLRVSVSDTGPGVAERDRQRIFEEFQQADSSSRRGATGTGLGLAIARRIVELHGGRIWVEPQLRGGSTFTFTLPARVERAMALV